ncbi:hypothetical protein Tsubulata_041314, partial [Turnera subulata]
LPDLLGNLKNLRYMGLSGSGIVRLPTTMNGLKNLRHLDIRGTKISEMPPQLGQLTMLVVLTDIFIGKGKNDSIAELGPLEHLGGELCIWNLENVVHLSHAIGANLRGKRNIEKLELRGGSHCSVLPAFGQLEVLTELKIECFDSIVRIGPEFYGSSSNKKSFPSLEKLTFSSMPRLEQLMPPPIRAFPLLQKLRLEHCPVFESLYCGGDEEGALTSLHSLRILRCSKFISFPGQGLRAPNLRELELRDSDALEELPKHMNSLLPSLTELTLSFCTKLRSFPEGGLPSSIEILEIWGCDGIESSPEGGFPTNLEKLIIHSCDKLFADRRNWGLLALQSLSSLRISGSEEVLESFPEETLLPPSLNSLWMGDFKHLKSLDN